ncbi:MAG TPA: hypothetical protein VKP00_10295 [Gemmatimonadaceae bacterium]|nr:hypothetical protein [Gemmatimonadaceae bacterium]
MSGAFARIEYQLRTQAFEPMVVRVAVQCDVVMVAKRGIEVAWIVDDDDPAFVPDEFEGGFHEVETALRNRGFQRVAFLIVVAEHTPQRRLQRGERVDGFRLSDVAGVNDALDARRVEEFDDLRDVREVVVGVSDDADTHDIKKAAATVPIAAAFVCS